MSGARPETPEEPHMLAGEYVLGVLESTERRAVDNQATFDPQLAGAITGWERRLHPLLTAVPDVAPPDTLWSRIEHAKSRTPQARPERQPPTLVASVPSPAPRLANAPAWPRPAAARRVWPWKVSTAASLALAAGLAAFMLVPAQAPQPNAPMPAPVSTGRDVSLVAVLTQPESPGDARHDTAPQMAADTGSARLIEPQAGAPDVTPPAARVTGFLAAAWPDGTVVLTAFAPLQVPNNRSLELWIKPPDATAPKSLGVLSGAGRQAILPAAPADGTVLFVTVEPAGGSPTGAPTGRIAYSGTLREVRR